jgi:hypothetical protein
MPKKMYKVLSSIIRGITPRMKTTWEEPFDGEACVFVGNHAGAFGPIDMCVKFPLRDQCYTWMNADVLDPKLVPAYVRQDYWWKPGCKLEPLYNATLPYMAAAVLPPILRLAPTVPVYHDMRVMTTMRQSLRHLKEGHHLVIFPEQPSGYQSHHDWINTGFLQIAPMYYKATGKILKFYPVHLDYHKHTFKVAKPIAFDPERTLEEQTPELVEVLAKGLRGL